MPALPKVGLAQLAKEGTRQMAGEEGVMGNIGACHELSKLVRSSLGPKGMNKLVVNHLGKSFLTKDSATIIQELELEHPAAKLIVMAAQDQAVEMGDGATSSIVFAGELLNQAGDLLNQGLTVQDIRRGFELATTHILKELESDVAIADNFTDITKENVARLVDPVVSSKLGDLSMVVSPLIGEAVETVARNGKFTPNSIQVAKLMGGNLSMSAVVRGVVMQQVSRTTVTELKDANIAVYACPLDYEEMETKGTVVLETAEDLKNYSNKEESHMEKLIQDIVDAGVNTIVVNGSIGDLALHYCEMKGLMVIRIHSKFELRRIASSVGASVLVNLLPPSTKQMGHSDEIYTKEFGDVTVTIARNNLSSTSSGIATVVLRAATKNLIEDVDRAVANGVNTTYHMTKDPVLVAGGGAIEMFLAHSLLRLADNTADLSQYAIRAYAVALQQIPRVLAETGGMDATTVIANLMVAQEEGKTTMGVNISDMRDPLLDMKAAGVLDHRGTKYHMLQGAAQAAVTVLSVDHLIMSKQAGGPAPRG
ncbi:Chaperonin Cpn60/TCP-1 [Carpediemonas membranifera]|uniref:CCT-theta n=1 Tax=Carpediemonas membranifera TaxID=201153 RepID=A0A8J6E9V8_9EUKA|nr:Chaperonin Cpn60/TCP-1 [Carpediemonas membranifera]|eukprot:KAG9393880.1 Chaperonin Cpn60/TCP-1 [Carpediemonas membranifera]